MFEDIKIKTEGLPTPLRIITIVAGALLASIEVLHERGHRLPSSRIDGDRDFPDREAGDEESSK